MCMYGGLRSGCMECAAAGGCLPPRPLSAVCAAPSAVYTPRRRPVAATSCARAESRKNLFTPKMEKIFLICLHSV